MQQTRRELIDEVLDFVGHKDDSEARDTVELILNRALRTIWGKHAWRAFLHPTPYELSTVSGTRAYALPSRFGRTSGTDGVLRNLTTGQKLYPTTRERLEESIPTAGTSFDSPGQPSLYQLAGTTPVHTQPATTGDALEVVSNSAADTTVRVLVGGVNSVDQWTQTQVTLTGTAPVAIGTWKEIHEFGKAYPDGTDPTTELTSSEGTVTLRKVTGAVELQALLSFESAQERQTIVFYPAPDAVYTIAIPFIRAIQKAWRDADPLPSGWSNALFEEMEIEWQVQAGDLSRAAAMQLPRPKLVDLVCDENAAAAQQQRRRVPYRAY